MRGTPEETHSLIEHTLSHVDDLWFPTLTEVLVRHGQEASRTDFESYSTSKFLSDRVLGPLVEHPIFEPSSRFQSILEVPASRIQDSFGELGLEFVSPEAVVESEMWRRIETAIGEVDRAPSIGLTIRQLAWRIHILKTQGDAFDVSYSDPSLPFSIFVSVPGRIGANESWRVAEGLIHESMHLQLTLMESLSPMVLGVSDAHYSPWKHGDRPVGGVLHGLYVFAVIYQWFGFFGSNNEYASRRRSEIAAEVNEIKDFADAGGLTGLGRILARKSIRTILGT